MSNHAQAAKLIRQDLKKHFSKKDYPSLNFSVTSKTYSGGDSITVSWQDGPASMMVKEIVKRYQYGHFDGMTDSYEYSNRDDSIPQVQFVRVQRYFTESDGEKSRSF